MPGSPIRTVYDMWPQYDRRLREVIGAMSAEQLAIRPSPERWPINGTTQVHTRGSILQRMFSHEAYHCGELSQTLGIHGLPQIDLWRPD